MSSCLVFYPWQLNHEFVEQAPEMFEGKRISEKVRHHDRSDCPQENVRLHRQVRQKQSRA